MYHISAVNNYSANIYEKKPIVCTVNFYKHGHYSHFPYTYKYIQELVFDHGT